MKANVVNLSQKLSLINDHWSPATVADLNDLQVRLAKLQGDFVWHRHAETDEAFFVLDGELLIEFRDGSVALSKGEMVVVPAGVEHKPRAESECHVMVIVRKGTFNTGDAPRSERTTDPDARV